MRLGGPARRTRRLKPRPFSNGSTLAVGPLLDDQSTGGDHFTHVLAEPVYRTIGAPRDVGVDVQRVATGHEPQQLDLRYKTFHRGWFTQRHLRQVFESGRCNQPTLPLVGGASEDFR